MTYWMRPPDIERSRERDVFDPLAEGARYHLASELLLEIWRRACADATDGSGRRDAPCAEQRFHELAGRVAARGGRRHPDPGRISRVAAELDGMHAPLDELAPRAPGRATQVARSDAGGSPMDPTTQSAMAQRIGADFTDVRVHVDDDAARAASELGAVAFTVGSDIYFAAGQYRPDHPRGRRLLAHELAHVVQQRGGSGGARVAGGPAYGAAEIEADAAAAAVMAGAPPPRLSAAPIAVQRQDHGTVIDVEIVGHVTENHHDGAVHRVGDNAGPSILMDIELLPGGATVYRWFNFEAGEQVTSTAADWNLRFAAAAAFDRNEAFAQLGRRLTPEQWRALWPDPVPELMRRYEAGTLAISDPGVLTAYRGMVRTTARRQLDENERAIDDLLNAPDRVAQLQEFADGLREASIVRDRLIERRSDLERAQAQAHSFTFGIAGNFQNMDPAQRLRRAGEIAQVTDSLDGWLAAFPLLTRLRTAEINRARVEATLRAIKSNIIATRGQVRPGGGLDPMDLEGTRARVPLGPRAAGVVNAEDRSRARWRIAGAVAATAGMIALLFLPGGAFIDAAIGVAMAVQSWEEASVIGRAANTGLHVDDGLMTQEQANAARWGAILSTVLAVVGAAGAAFRVLRVARAYLNVRRALPELQLAQQAQLARALSTDTALMDTLVGPGARGDPFVLSRVRAAVRDLGHDPAELRRALETTGELARIPRRIVENDAYAPIRAITDGSDVDAIARITGMSREQVAAARQHFFLDEQILVDDAGALYRSRFVPYDRDARIWLQAGRGTVPAAEDLTHLRRLIRHESVEAAAMAAQGRTLEQAFLRGELEGMLRRLLSQHMPPDRVAHTMTSETRPIMPFRYAHYWAHFNGGPNP